MAFRRPRKSHPFLVALLATSVSSAVLAQDGYIVQPKLRVEAPVEQAAPHKVAPGENKQSASAEFRSILELDEPTAETTTTPTPRVPTSDTTAAMQELLLDMNSKDAASKDGHSASHERLRWVKRNSEAPNAAEIRAEKAPTLRTTIEFKPLEISLADSPDLKAPKTATVPLPQVNPAELSARSESAQAAGTKNPSTSIPTMQLASAQTNQSNADEKRRTILASMVSQQIIAESGQIAKDAPVAGAIDAPPGWQAVGESLSANIAQCELLLNRRAFYSARAEAEQAMLHLVRVLDLIENQYLCEPAWLEAKNTLSECDDFAEIQSGSSASGTLRRVVYSHQTTALKQVNLEQLSPMAAAQHYRQYALEKLVEATQGHPWASDIMYAIGRTYQAESELAETSTDGAKWRAVTFYRAAHEVTPNNAIASNQLGFIYLQMDRPSDARQALVASVNAGPSKENLQNLAEASRRLGDSNTYHWATNNLLALQATVAPSAPGPRVLEIDPATFAAISPYAGGPNGQTPVPDASTNHVGPSMQAVSFPVQQGY